MKTAVFIKDAITQIVLTPETDWEKTALADLFDGCETEVRRGSFYETRGGWDRLGSGDESVMIRVTNKP